MGHALSAYRPIGPNNPYFAFHYAAIFTKNIGPIGNAAVRVSILIAGRKKNYQLIYDGKGNLNGISFM